MILWLVATGSGACDILEDIVVTSIDGLGEEQLMKILKGSIAMSVTYSIMRDKDTFDCSDEWLPNRWGKPMQHMKTASIPLMVGGQSSPGQLLPITESEVFLAWLLMEYNWSLVKETQPECMFTLKIKGAI